MQSIISIQIRNLVTKFHQASHKIISHADCAAQNILDEVMQAQICVEPRQETCGMVRIILITVEVGDYRDIRRCTMMRCSDFRTVKVIP